MALWVEARNSITFLLLLKNFLTLKNPPVASNFVSLVSSRYALGMGIFKPSAGMKSNLPTGSRTRTSRVGPPEP